MGMLQGEMLLGVPRQSMADISGMVYICEIVEVNQNQTDLCKKSLSCPIQWSLAMHGYGTHELCQVQIKVFISTKVNTSSLSHYIEKRNLKYLVNIFPIDYMLKW